MVFLEEFFTGFLLKYIFFVRNILNSLGIDRSNNY